MRVLYTASSYYSLRGGVEYAVKYVVRDLLKMRMRLLCLLESLRLGVFMKNKVSTIKKL